MTIKIQKSEFQELYNIACNDWKGKFTNKFKDQLFEEELTFEESFLEEMKKACNEKQLKVFNKIFKKFLPENVYESINSYSDICKKLGIGELCLHHFSFLPEDQQKSQFALHRLSNITKFFNKRVKVDFSNPSQYKYFNWYEFKNEKWVFDVTGYFCVFSCFPVGCYFLNKADAEFCATKFYDIYVDLLS